MPPQVVESGGSKAETTSRIAAHKPKGRQDARFRENRLVDAPETFHQLQCVEFFDAQAWKHVSSPLGGRSIGIRQLQCMPMVNVHLTLLDSLLDHSHLRHMKVGNWAALA